MTAPPPPLPPGPPGPPGYPGYPGYPSGYPGYPPAGRAPNNHLVMSIIGLLFCLPPAIVAVVKSSHVNGLWAQGRYGEAQAAADSAKTWALWSIILGILGSIILFATIAVLGGLAIQNSNDDSSAPSSATAYAAMV